MALAALLAGLGNPGSRYAASRHNLGFMVVDEVARRYQFSPWRRRFQSLAASGEVDGRRCLLLKPQTFMNRSGAAVAAALRYYRLESDCLLVFCDDMDLAAGKVRVRCGGGDGGHRGLRDVAAACGAGYVRVRMGVGRPLATAGGAEHVLADFGAGERLWVGRLLAGAATHLPLLLAGSADAFMSKMALAARG